MILSEQCPCIAVSPLRSPEEELEEPEEVEKEAGLVGDKKVKPVRDLRQASCASTRSIGLRQSGKQTLCATWHPR